MTDLTLRCFLYSAAHEIEVYVDYLVAVSLDEINYLLYGNFVSDDFVRATFVTR